MVESIQHVLDRIRTPRVHITYDVEIGGAFVMKELPFVIGIMADLAGMQENPLPTMKFRKFTEIDRDNFSEFMVSTNPRVAIQVKNTLGGDAENLNAELFFKHMEDFNPTSIAKQIPKLKKMYDARVRLNDLVAKLEGNDPLNDYIGEIASDIELKTVLKKQIDAILKANKQSITSDFSTTTGSVDGSDYQMTDGAAKDDEDGKDKDKAADASTAGDASSGEAKSEDAATDAATGTEGDAAADDSAPKEREILKEIFINGKLAREPSAEVGACAILLELLLRIEMDKITSVKNALVFVEKHIYQIDSALNEQIDKIIHHPAFQEMEGTWRALYYLVMNTETSTQLKLRVMHVTKKELLDDLENAIEFDQSALFKKVYEEEYGTFGGHPYSCLVGGYEFTRHPQDIELLEKISNVAAAAHAPFITAAHPRMFDINNFSLLGGPRDLAKIFESTEMIKWRSFRDSEDSRYVALVLPRVLMRLPYGSNTLPVDGMQYEENIDGEDNSCFCWGSAAFIFAQRIGHAISLYKWPAAIRGVEGGGLVEGLPAYTFKTTDGDIALKCPTEIAITDRREKELSDLGFLAICHSKGTDFAAFFGGQTTQKPKLYNLDIANANASLSTKLPYLLAASRFAHYIKAIMRDKVGAFLSKQDVSMYLNNWIANYVLLNETASQELKSKYPLREARIDVYEIPGKPGCYKATVFLRPHFQLEELTASIRLVAELPPPAQ
ncbi:MAG: type VI secretion system contractile sheath large subunit [Holosporaceae bacterium]|jgi:type VI secretion system protein ImpC|nr:type VI secretion system contractile sheath large subunit [Holosporaceae bacterium]